MTAAFPFLIVGLLLVLFLILSLAWTNRPSATQFEPYEDDRLRAIGHTEPLPQGLAARLFGPEDREFIAKQGCVSLKRLFRQQRTELALFWLRSVRANAASLMRIHNGAARRNPGLEPLLELRILGEYFAVQAICQTLALAIWVRGPANLSRMVGYVDNLSNQFHEGIRQLFPAELAAANSNSHVHQTGS